VLTNSLPESRTGVTGWLARLVAKFQGDGFEVVSHNRATGHHLKVGRSIDRRGDVFRVRLRELLADSRRDTRCPIAREGITIALELLDLIDEAERHEDDHVFVYATERVGKVDQAGLRIVARSERLLRRPRGVAP
jgi:hypothetical protein